MAYRKYRTGEQGSDPFILHQRQHAIVYEGIERHLLEQAKGEVGV